MDLLTVSKNRKFLVRESGEPFFWLGDTAWVLFNKLNREEADFYLESRAAQGFNVVQAAAFRDLDEQELESNAYGRKPLKMNKHGEIDPALPDTDGENHYWTHVDYIVDKAASLGIYIAMLPTWGIRFHAKPGKSTEIFTVENAREYGLWLGERYRDRNNLLWVLGGDRALTKRKHFEIIHSMARGIMDGDGGRHLITFHPPGNFSSSFYVHDENWLNFNMIQSGHGEEVRVQANYIKVAEDYNRIPSKPVLDSEPCYEDHPIGFRPQNGYFDEADVRKAAYYAVFSGAFGHTYGHHSVRSMTTEPSDYTIMHWKEAIHRPGSVQMRYLQSLIESFPMLERVPDQRLVAENYEGANYMAATRGTNYALIYFPNGLKGKIQMGLISGETIRASWFDPRKGDRLPAGVYANNDTVVFEPPQSGRGNDWVLVLESVVPASL
ncbi:MAG: hypothetical protein K0S39_423 [Paenibacillus sp.]|jgi:hypothetical protein|nr:hypothetical protein [Paenibacillus sp.]